MQRRIEGDHAAVQAVGIKRRKTKKPRFVKTGEKAKFTIPFTVVIGYADLGVFDAYFYGDSRGSGSTKRISGANIRGTEEVLTIVQAAITNGGLELPTNNDHVAFSIKFQVIITGTSATVERAQLHKVVVKGKTRPKTDRSNFGDIFDELFRRK